MLLKKNGSQESSFWFSESVVEFGFLYGCSSMNYSNSYNMITYFSIPRSCLVRYVLDTKGQLKLFMRRNGADAEIESWPLVTLQSPPAHQSPKGDRRGNTTKHVEKSGKKNYVTWIAIVALALLASVFVGITVLLRFTWRKGSSTSFEGGDTLKQYKLRDLQKATKNFTQKLGEGGFSIVYKGELPDSTYIAVKELQGLLQKEKQLRAELNTVGLIQHKNLVRLHGICRRNMDLLNNELDSYFPALVLNALNHGAEMVPLVDSKLEGELDVEELTRAFKVACWCIQDHENDRPTMTQVVQILEGFIDVGIPPIPQFFQSIFAEDNMNESDIKGSEVSSTLSTLSASFTFEPLAYMQLHKL
ncbi:hypothetical protein RJT34_31266 [Clitoria ternatea]|uniref:Protein kinase domain-containing protein n=1 Tax=Clitoria ternatea TaxID=43366 RepID=A0AAN9EU02_CLITE